MAQRRYQMNEIETTSWHWSDDSNTRPVIVEAGVVATERCEFKDRQDHPDWGSGQRTKQAVDERLPLEFANCNFDVNFKFKNTVVAMGINTSLGVALRTQTCSHPLRAQMS